MPVSVVDNLSAPFQTMHQHVSNMVNEMNKFQQAMSRPITPAFNAGAMVPPLQQVGNQTNMNTQSQREHNQTLSEGANNATGLLGKIKGIAGVYLGLQGLKKMIDFGDQISGTTARLDIMNDGLRTTNDLNRMIYESAQESRVSFTDTANVVAKLGMLAGDAFRGNDELVKFTTLMNKSFALSGAGIQEKTAAMYQLTQAMASGRLQGDEFRSILENAPMLAQAIKKELNGIDMKKASSEGLITADVIKRAMFHSADEINGKFDELPLKFSDIASRIKNNFVVGMAPLAQAISRLWNNKYVIAFANNLVVVFSILGHIGAMAFDAINYAITFVGNNMQWLGPIILALVAIYAVLNAGLLVSAWRWVADTAAKVANTVADWALTAATIGLIIAQDGLNAALLACPLTWIVIAVIAVIGIYYALVGVYNRVTGQHISATGILIGVFFMLGAFVFNIFKNIANVIAIVAEFLVNVFRNPVSAVKMLLLNMARNALSVARSMTSCFDSVATNLANGIIDGVNMAISAINWLIDALNMIPGINIGKVGMVGHIGSITHTIDNKIKDIDGMMSDIKSKDKDYTSIKKLEFTNLGDAFNSGYSFGEGMANKVKNLFNFNKDDDKDKKQDYSQYLKDAGLDPAGGAGKGGAGKALKDTAKNTKRSADALDNAKLDVKYLREMAERQAINRFTTAQINIENTINGVPDIQDLDGMVDHLNDRLQKELEIQVDGYYKV